MRSRLMKKKAIIKFFLSFLFYFALQFKFLNDAWFGTDELDIMVVGKSIARGQLLYKDVCSQHMPFSYYFSAFFDLIGFRTVDEQRLAFYFLIAVLWAVVYVRYSHVINGKALLLAPVVLCSVLQSYDMGTEILSEHLAGCGAVILLLEYLDFINTKKITIGSSVMISVAVVLTFGTIFISIYSIFFIGVGVLILEIKQFRNEKEKISLKIINLIKKYLKLIIIVAIPWMVLFTYYKATDSFGDFIFGSYTLNRTIYQEYNGGMGSNVFSLFLQPIDMVGGFFTSTMNIAEWNYTIILFWVVLIGSVIYVCKLWLAGNKTESVIIFMFTYSLGIRGIFNFHGTACVQVLTLLFSSILFSEFIGTESEFKNKSVYKQAFVFILIFFVLSGYFKDISEVTSIKINDDEMNMEAKIVNALTEEDEKVWCPVLSNYILMLADRPVGLGYPATPWTWRGYKKNFKKEKKNPARVMIYFEGLDVWGNNQDEYAKPIKKLVKKKYTQVDGMCVYVRNDYYEEARKIIDSIE